MVYLITEELRQALLSESRMMQYQKTQSMFQDNSKDPNVRMMDESELRFWEQRIFHLERLPYIKDMG